MCVLGGCLRSEARIHLSPGPFGPGLPEGQEGSDGKGSLVRLEVPVHDAIVVQVLQCQHRLSEVHAGHLHGQGPDVLQQGGAVPPCGGRSREERGTLSLKLSTHRAPSSHRTWLPFYS